jgi:Na+/H+-translocating membrane pyrophosphatase
VAACMTILVISVFTGYRIPAIFSGIALLAVTKLAGFKIVAHMKRR